MNLFLKIILATALAGVLTYFCISIGLDWSWAVFFNKHDFWVSYAVPFVIAGMVVPIAIPLIAFIIFRRNKTDRTRQLAKKSLWSFITAYLVMTTLKVFTNRVDMEPFEPIGWIDFSGHFRFGFMNSNHWWESLSEGWPSGHTMIAVSMAIAIHPFLNKKGLKVLNILYPVCIALSVSTAFHWFSDVISGALIGTVIGFYFQRSTYSPRRN